MVRKPAEFSFASLSMICSVSFCNLSLSFHGSKGISPVQLLLQCRNGGAVDYTFGILDKDLDDIVQSSQRFTPGISCLLSPLLHPCVGMHERIGIERSVFRNVDTAPPGSKNCLRLRCASHCISSPARDIALPLFRSLNIALGPIGPKNWPDPLSGALLDG